MSRQFEVLPLNPCAIKNNNPHEAHFVVVDKYSDRKFKVCGRHIEWAKLELKKMEGTTQ